MKICVETEQNRKKLAINLPHNQPLKVKERVLNKEEFGVDKLNDVNGVEENMVDVFGI